MTDINAEVVTPVVEVTLDQPVVTVEFPITTINVTVTPGGTPAAGSGGVTDHGALTGLADDDHPHYLTTARGDGRYDANGAATASMSAHTGAADPHPIYLTSTEGNAAYAATGHAHGGVYDPAGTAAAGDSAHTGAADPHPQYAADAHDHPESGPNREYHIYERSTAPAAGDMHIEALGGLAYRVRVAYVDAQGTPYTLEPTIPGDTITLTDNPETPPVTEFYRYIITGSPVDGGTYWQVDCERTTSSGGTITAGALVRFIPTLSGGSVSAPLGLNDLTDVDTAGAVNGEVLGYVDGTWHPVAGGGSGDPGVSDHGALTGLLDDDHTQYLTAARGDSRYDALGAASSGDSAHTSAGDPHPQYLTPTEGNAAYATTGHTHATPTIDHGATTGLADDDHTQYALVVIAAARPTSPRVGTIWAPAP